MWCWIPPLPVTWLSIALSIIVVDSSCWIMGPQGSWRAMAGDFHERDLTDYLLPWDCLLIVS